MDRISRIIASLKTYIRGIALPGKEPLFKVTPMVDEMQSQSSPNTMIDVYNPAAQMRHLDYLENFHDG